MDSLLEEMLEKTKIVVPSTAGESLFSPATVRLIKKINEKFPKIRYSITTNGLMINDEILANLELKTEYTNYQFLFMQRQRKHMKN